MDIGVYGTTHGVGYRDDVNFFVACRLNCNAR
jgi:hypothetical protein